jgi:hypothetical protein
MVYWHNPKGETQIIALAEAKAIASENKRNKWFVSAIIPYRQTAKAHPVHLPQGHKECRKLLCVSLRLCGLFQ